MDAGERGALDAPDTQALHFPPRAQKAYFRGRRWLRLVGKHPILVFLGFLIVSFFTNGIVISIFDTSCSSDDCLPTLIAVLAFIDVPFVAALAVTLGTVGHRFRAWRATRMMKKRPTYRVKAMKDWALGGVVDATDVDALKARLKAGEDDLLPRVRRVIAVFRGSLFWLAVVIIFAAFFVVAALAEEEIGLGIWAATFWLAPLTWVAHKLATGIAELTRVERGLNQEWESSLDSFEDEILRRHRSRFAAPAPPPATAHGPTPGRATYRRT